MSKSENEQERKKLAIRARVLATIAGLKEPLPINDETDIQALHRYGSLSSLWRLYQSPEATEEQRAETARVIKKMYDSSRPKKKPGRRSKTVELELYIDYVCRESIRVIFKIYRDTKNLAIKKGVLKKREKEALSLLIDHLEGWERLSAVGFAEGWQSRFEQLIWTGKKGTSGFVNDAIAAIQGDTRAALTKRRQRELKK